VIFPQVIIITLKQAPPFEKLVRKYAEEEELNN
jgi:hypothetical protein